MTRSVFTDRAGAAVRCLRSIPWLAAIACICSCNSAPPPPAETGTAPDAVCASCLEAPVRWRWSGGLSLVTEDSGVAPCRTYHRERSVFGRPEAGASCSAELRCDASDLGVRRLRQLLRHPDVQRALASGHDGALFGCDLRPVDVPIFVIEADGGSFGVGADCSECAGPRECESPPAGVGDLVRFLRDLDDRMEQREPCRSALEPR